MHQPIGLFNMRISCLAILLSLIQFTPATASTSLPTCFHILSDQDGDGFGYENSTSCIVDDSTRSLAEPNLCIDDNADGYGWNGIETCLVEIPINPNCEDTEPTGDGWGWNGSESCRVVPLPTETISELEIIKSRLVDIPSRTGFGRIAAFYCASTDETVFLKISGFMEYFIGEESITEGTWTTGLYDKDNSILIQFASQDVFPFPFSRILFDGDEVLFGNTLASCTWLDN